MASPLFFERLRDDLGLEPLVGIQLLEAPVREAPQGCKHMVRSDHLGTYLTALAATLNEAPGMPKEANCLLLTYDHAIALHVERKCKDGVDYFSAKLYDPNDTAKYTRVERPNAEALGSLTLEDMLITRELCSRYAGEGNASLLMVAVSLNHDLQPQMDRSDPTCSAQNVYLALCQGAHTELQSMLQTLPQKPDAAFTLLQAKTSAVTGPGAFIALQYGYTETVKAFTEVVLKSKLNEAVKAELLAAKRGDGTPGLSMTLQLGHAETVKAFTVGVLKSTLNENVKAELLAAKSDDGTPGLALALQDGHFETVKAFTKAVLYSSLSEQVKTALLVAKRKDDITGLFMALQEGHAKTVKAFTEAVLSSTLNESVKAELLAAKSGDGTAGLALALQDGHIETVKAFTEAVLKSTLNESVKAELTHLPPPSSTLTVHKHLIHIEVNQNVQTTNEVW